MTISKPTVGTTGWNTAVDAVIDAVDQLTAAPQTLTAVTGVITPNASAGTVFRHTATADVQLADPINGTDGQTIRVQVTASGGSRTLSFATGGVPSVLIPSGGWWRAQLEFISPSAWLLIA